MIRKTGFILAAFVTGALIFGSLNATPVIMGTNSTEAMRIDPTGNVGIVTSSPDTTLHVENSASAGTGGDPAVKITQLRKAGDFLIGLTQEPS